MQIFRTALNIDLHFLSDIYQLLYNIADACKVLRVSRKNIRAATMTFSFMCNEAPFNEDIR